MKIRITNIPVRINGERVYPGTELDVTKDFYKTIKSNCIIVDDGFENTVEEVEKLNKVEKPKTNDELLKESKSYKEVTKDEIMIELAGKGIEFDPNQNKLTLFKMLGRD